jgi:hypothetical protein
MPKKIRQQDSSNFELGTWLSFFETGGLALLYEGSAPHRRCIRSCERTGGANENIIFNQKSKLTFQSSAYGERVLKMCIFLRKSAYSLDPLGWT